MRKILKRIVARKAIIFVILGLGSGVLFLWFIQAQSERIEFYRSVLFPNRPLKTHLPSGSDVQEIIFWRKGQRVSLRKTEELMRILLSTLQKLNLLSKCSFTREKIREIKESGEFIELVFRRPTNITISQQIVSKDRSYIKTDKRGFRILDRVKRAIFVLKGDYKGSVLVGRQWENEISYSCWSIRRGVIDGIDENWVKEIEKKLR